MFKRISLIDSQIRVYAAWMRRKNESFQTYYLEEFSKLSGISDVMDMTDQDVVDYILSIGYKYNSTYELHKVRTSLNTIRRFYMARSKNIKRPAGKPPKVEEIEMVKKYRNVNKLNFRTIAILMKRNVSLVHRWYYYDPEKLALHKDFNSKNLSTGKQL